jgi:hypothetical protein
VCSGVCSARPTCSACRRVVLRPAHRHLLCTRADTHDRAPARGGWPLRLRARRAHARVSLTPAATH